MDIHIYCGNIGVPLKCGSRFLQKTIPYWGEPKKISFNDDNYDLDYIIIRNPLSHLKSALKTEVLECFNDKYKICKILNTFSVQNRGGNHFNPNFCEMVYNKWKQSEWKLNVIDLSNLSKFINEKLHEIKFNESEYDFHDGQSIDLSVWGYKSKEEIWNRCMELFPYKMKRLIDYTTEDIKWYNALLNNDRTLTPKISYSDYTQLNSIVLFVGSTIEESFKKKKEIKLYYRGDLNVFTYLYTDDIIFTEAQGPFYFDNDSQQVFHLDSSTNVGMITKITLRPKRIITVTSGQTKICGDKNPLTYTYTLNEPLVGSDILIGELVREKGESVGSYKITQGSLSNDNYDLIFVGDNFTITKKFI